MCEVRKKLRKRETGVARTKERDIHVFIYRKRGGIERPATSGRKLITWATLIGKVNCFSLFRIRFMRSLLGVQASVCVSVSVSV